MASLTPAEEKRAGYLFWQEFLSLSGIANLNTDDIAAAINAIDTMMDMLPTNAALNTSLTIKQNFLALLPEPFKTNASATQKAWAMVIWTLREQKGI